MCCHLSATASTNTTDPNHLQNSTFPAKQKQRREPNPRREPAEVRGTRELPADRWQQRWVCGEDVLKAVTLTTKHVSLTPAGAPVWRALKPALRRERTNTHTDLTRSRTNTNIYDVRCGPENGPEKNLRIVRTMESI